LTVIGIELGSQDPRLYRFASSWYET